MKELNINELENNMDETQDRPKNEKKKRHGLESLIAFSLALVLLIGSSFAYFTDYAAMSTQGTAGTVSISLDSDINLLDENGMDILNPGDIRSGSFTVTNMGNKSADIRTTIALTAFDRNGDPIDLEGSATTQSMYDLYLAGDVEEVPGQGHKPKVGAQPLQTKTINGNVITYSIPEYSLNGNSDLYDEVEVIAPENRIVLYAAAQNFNNTITNTQIIPSQSTAVSDYEVNCDFVLVFNTAAGNEFQGSVVRIDIIVEAKQHENTQSGWQICEHEDITVGSLSQSVVVPENVITTNGTINPGYEYTPSTSGSGNSETSQYATLIMNIDVTDPELEENLCYSMDGWLIMSDSDSHDLWFTDDDNNYIHEHVVENLLPNTQYSILSAGGPMMTFTTGDAGTTIILNIEVSPTSSHIEQSSPKA